jgi:signal transduction histidine kinase
MFHGPAVQPDDARLRGWRLAVARAAWLAVSALSLGLYVASIPPYYARSVAFSAPHMHAPGAVKVGLEQLGIPVAAYAGLGVAMMSLLVAVFAGVGALIFWRKPADPAALFFSLVLVVFGAIWPNTLDALPDRPVLEFLNAGLNSFGFSAFFLLLYLFPDGRFVPRWTRWFAAAFVVAVTLDAFFSGTFVDTDTWPSPYNQLAMLVEVPTFLGTMIYAQVYRYRRVSTRVQRQQTKWVMSALVVTVLGFVGTAFLEQAPLFNRPGVGAVLFDVGTSISYILAFMLVPVAIGTAVLRYRLWDIDPILNRALVYGALTASIVGLYVLLVGYLGVLFRVEDNLLVSLAATGVVAVLFAPLRDWLQRGVNRLMYGERDDPYAVISRLGRRLEATLATDEVLPTAVRTVREALKLPYAAVVLGSGITVASGTPVYEPSRLPLVYQGETVGQLLLSPRSPGESWTPADLRLLEDLTRQVGVAAHAVRLTDDLRRLNENLQSSRERLVTAREEERRRLRRDLHDELAPTLAALALTVSAVGDLIPTDPATARSLVAELEADIRATVGDIRTLAYELRPPVLDELGLLAAIRERASQHGTHPGTGPPTPAGIRVIVDAPESLPPLPAAVEVAAYRIAQEALTNVFRHSGAGVCTVRLCLADGLLVEVTDDGTGLPAQHRVGIGLHSMRERAAELGGTCQIERMEEGGTRVCARLPVRRG